MKFTYHWLRDFVDTDLTAGEIADLLPLVGFELDGFESTLPALHGIFVGKVLACQPLPPSGHLTLCQVDLGDATLEVVCGAPNVAAGQMVALAPPGSTLPNGQRIETRAIMGVTSQGMICSENELGLSDEADRILVLDGRARPGQPLRQVLPEDWVFDIAVTPNRPDALGVIGVAREVALLSGAPLRLPKVRLSETGPARTFVDLRIKDTIGCPRYAARLLHDVKVKPSPRWMVQRLNAVGIRALSNLVDVTNYVMMETGQPLHAFDFDRLEKGRIVVQRARAGERFTTLDEKEHELDAEDLLICDGVRPVALAGVMGGLNSEVSSATRNVLIECAYFDPLTVRRTAKRHDFASESARRFERGVDPNGIPYALDRAAQLMHETAGGRIARGRVEHYPVPYKPVRISFRPRRVTHVLGIRVPRARMEKILSGLGCKVARKNTAWQVTVPTLRPDLVREIDLIEEVARHHGYQHLEEKIHSRVAITAEANREEEVLEQARQTLLGMGFDEAVTFDFLSARKAQLFRTPGTEVLPLLNPANEELTTMRPALAASLLHAIAYNLNRKNHDVWLYEVGSVFWRTASQGIGEQRHVGALATGAAEPRSWQGGGRRLTVHDVRGFVETLAHTLGLPAPVFAPLAGHHFLELGWEIQMNGRAHGWAGALKREILAAYEIEEPVFGFELLLDQFAALVNWNRTYRAIPRFPAVERDLAVVVDAGVPAGTVTAAIAAAGGPHLEKVELFDLYTGNQIPAGKKSLAYALVFRSLERTLRDAEVEEWQSRILAELQQQCGAVLRS